MKLSFIETILFIIAAAVIFNAVFVISKRINGVRAILKLKGECGAKIRFYRFPISSFVRLTKKPDLSVELGDRLYLLRFINGKNRFKYLHFASEEFFVTYSKAIFTLGGFLHIRGRYRITENLGFSTTSRRSVKILPKLEIPEQIKDYCEKNKKSVIPVLIFSPAPREINYVVEKKTSVMPANFGDKMFSSLLFSPSSFATYADRVKRESELYGKSISRSSEMSFR